MRTSRTPRASIARAADSFSKCAEKAISGGESRPRLAFYAPVADDEVFDIIGFYADDLSILADIGFEVHRCRRLADVRRADPAVVYAWWWHSSVLLALYCALRRIPLVVTGATDLTRPDQTRLLRWSRTVLTAVVGRLATANLAISDNDFIDLERVRARNRQRMYLSVDTANYAFAVNRDIEPSAAMVAQMNPASIRRKGVDTAILAAVETAKLVPGFTLHLVGPETDEGRCQLDEMLRAVPPGIIRRHGCLDPPDKRALLQSVVVYLQPSRYEGFGVAVVEAMSCGAIPVVSGVGSLPELLGEAQPFEATPQALAAAIAEIFHSVPDEVERRRRSARSAAEAFDISIRRGELADFFGRLVGIAAHAPTTGT